MGDQFFYTIPGALLFIVLIILFFAAVEAGVALGNRSAQGASKEVEDHIATIEAALLGLLALLLGFGFSMAMSRFESRRSIVVSEANDIGTTYLRAGLLSPGHRDITRALLKKYLDSRIEFYRAGLDASASTHALQESTKLQNELWRQAEAVAAEGKSLPIEALFINTLNEMIDVQTERLAALDNHVPGIILVLLIFVGAASLALTGYRSGLTQVRLPVPRVTLVILVVATLYVIVDLDRPRRGFIQVSEQSLLKLKDSIEKLP